MNIDPEQLKNNMAAGFTEVVVKNMLPVIVTVSTEYILYGAGAKAENIALEIKNQYGCSIEAAEIEKVLAGLKEGE